MSGRTKKTTQPPAAPQRSIDLDPLDRLVVSWEEFEPIDRPESFHLDIPLQLERLQADREPWEFYGKFREQIAPQLNPDERSKLRAALASTMSPRAADPYSSYPANYLAGALVGCHAEIAACCALIPDDEYQAGSYNSWEATPEWLLFGLPDRETVIAEFQRIRLTLRSPEALVAWLALTEFDDLKMLADSVCGIKNKAEAAKMAKVIHRVVAPEMAVPALQIATSSKAPQVARKWLANHPLETAIGLASAASGPSKLAKAARDQFDIIDPAVLELASAHIDPETFQKLTAKLEAASGVQLSAIDASELPADLRKAFGALMPARLPDWLTLVALPPIQIDSKRLAPEPIEILITSLRTTPITETASLFATLKKYADPSSLDQFAWKLFELWAGQGYPAKDKWVMGAIGHLGGERCVVQLAPLIRKWPAESAFQRSILGLECMRVIGSDTALMTLSTVGEKQKYKSIKTRARAVMAEIAADRKISRVELDDRIIPDCGLDQYGRRSFDFGPRQFEFTLGPSSKPMARDAAGKLRASLPKANQSDDPLKAESATADWKIFKRTLQATLKAQSTRMKDAMIDGRRWSTDAFDELFIRHPFMLNLARQLLFGVFDDAGKISQSFRVTEDQSLADADEEPVALATGGAIGVLHPAHLKAGELSKWGELLSDYGIIPPFPQIGREVFRPDTDELDQTEFKRLNGTTLPGTIAYRILSNSGWEIDMEDYGNSPEHSKYFPAAATTAIIRHSGDYLHGLQLESIVFLAGRLPESSENQPAARKPLKLSEVDPIAFSETLRTANAIAAKET